MTDLKRTLRNERGITLLELLVAAFLSVLVVYAALEFYLTSHKSWLIQTDVAEVQQNARVCLDEMAGTLRMAGYGLPAGHAAFETGNDSLTVYYVRSGKVDTISYFVHAEDSSHTYLIRHVQGETPGIFADGVEAITVTEAGPRIFRLGLTARSERSEEKLLDGDGHRRRTLTTDVMVRNLSI